jgi:hypothetical protein
MIHGIESIVMLIDDGPSFGGSMVFDVGVIDIFVECFIVFLQSGCWRERYRLESCLYSSHDPKWKLESGAAVSDTLIRPILWSYDLENHGISKP